MTAAPRMPVAFIGHGSPMNTLEQNAYTQTWRALGVSLTKPKAVLMISAHWYTRGTFVCSAARPETIHDFGNFPQALFDFQYPAPGSPELAQRVARLLQPVQVEMDDRWGLDHGAWSVLAHVFPNADVPVVQLSIDATQAPQWHYDIAQRLAPLRDEGVLILGSGNVIHNLRIMNWREQHVAFDWAVRFNEAVKRNLQQPDHAALIQYERFGEDARLSIPTPEHYLPLLYVIALQTPQDTLRMLTDGIFGGSISMLSVVFGE
jgi:4,5-DOPA dioxygenase extradiol